MDAAHSATPATVATPQGQPQVVTPWPRPAQVATVFLLGVATTLLAVHACRGLRWGSRPTELQRSALAAYHIDLNRAEWAQLLQVPGVGDSLAQRIQEYRSQHGAFQNLSDLRQVRGIGPTTLERLRPWLCVGPPETYPVGESHTEITQRPPSRENRAGAADKTPGARQFSGKKEAQLTSPIDINLATAAELQRLPGIGPKRAQLIVEARQKRPFTSIEDLRHVSGVGPKTLERLRPYIVVESGPVRIATAGGS